VLTLDSPRTNGLTTASPAAATLRPRRLRLNATLRRMVRETVLAPADFVAPLFVRHGRNQRIPISSMPGQFQLSVDQLAAEAKEIAALGVPAVILFGIPAAKDALGSDNYSPDGIVPQAIRAIKDAAPDLVVLSDMCFCEYTDHGHCGVINLPGELHFHPAPAPRLPARRADA
jgi:porphobilinogen synthase